MSGSRVNADIERALRQALACREDRKRAEETLAALRAKHEEADNRLQELMRERESCVGELFDFARALKVRSSYFGGRRSGDLRLNAGD